MKNIDLYKELNLNDIVFVSGLTRSGKVLLCPIISSFTGVDKVSANFSLEQIPFLNYLNKIPYDTSVFLLKSGMNLMIYDNSIGRNANFRPNDFTSVWGYKDPMGYIERLTEKENGESVSKLISKNILSIMMVHNGLWHADMWFDAIPNLKFIHVQRNPVEIVYSWMCKNYDGEFSALNNSRDTTPTYLYKGKILPYYCYGWEDKFLSLGKVDKIIHLINKIREHHQNSYDSLNKGRKRKVMFIKHNDMLVNTESSLTLISKFIQRGVSKHTHRVCMEQNCPRSDYIETPFSTNNKGFESKLQEIKSLSSPEAYSILIDMHNQFESNKLAI